MKVKDAIEIMRPINDIMGSLTVIIGILNTRTGLSIQAIVINLIFGIITYFFIAASGMIINDIYDLNIDKINRPERPIPSGRISLKVAKILWITTIAIGMFLSIFNGLLLNIGYLNIIVAGFFAFIGWLYAAWGKKSGFPGNIIVSLSFSIGLIYGAILNSSIIPPYIYFFFLTSFFLLLSREVIKGCEDVEGDKEEAVKTLAIRLGIKNAKWISFIFAICAIIFFILPIFTNIINPLLFFISMIFGLVDVGAAVAIMAKSELSKSDLKKVSRFLKIGAFLGLVAFIFASI